MSESSGIIFGDINKIMTEKILKYYKDHACGELFYHTVKKRGGKEIPI